MQISSYMSERQFILNYDKGLHCMNVSILSVTSFKQNKKLRYFNIKQVDILFEVQTQAFESYLSFSKF